MLIALLNNSVRYKTKPNILRQIAEAVDKQLSTQVAAGWGVSPWNCQFIEDISKVPVGAYRLVIFDSADQANALGYHGQDALGNPYGRVFVNPIISNGGTDILGSLSVSAVVSHEACEIMLNPEINCWRQDKSGILYCQELCDAVQGDTYNINISNGSVAVSNFLLPAWFDYAPVTGSKFDFMGRLSRPFSLSRGGYVIMMSNGKITNKFGSVYAANKFSQDSSKFHDAARSMRVRSLNNKEKLTPEKVMSSFKENILPDHFKMLVNKPVVHASSGSSLGEIKAPLNALAFLNKVCTGRVAKLQEASDLKTQAAKDALSLVKDKENEVSLAQNELEARNNLVQNLQQYLDKANSELQTTMSKISSLTNELNATDDLKLKEKIQKMIDMYQSSINKLNTEIAALEIEYPQALKDAEDASIYLNTKLSELDVASANYMKLKEIADAVLAAVNAST